MQIKKTVTNSFDLITEKYRNAALELEKNGLKPKTIPSSSENLFRSFGSHSLSEAMFGIVQFIQRKGGLENARRSISIGVAATILVEAKKYGENLRNRNRENIASFAGIGLTGLIGVMLIHANFTDIDTSPPQKNETPQESSTSDIMLTTQEYSALNKKRNSN